MKEKKKTGRKGMIDSWYLAEGCFAEAAGVSTKLKINITYKLFFFFVAA